MSRPAKTPLRVTVWNEFLHERHKPAVRAIYPDGIHVVLRQALERLSGDAIQVRTATLEQPEHGLSAAVLDTTDVLLWWAHAAHAEVADETVTRVVQRVWQGMGLIVLHSAHASKIFQRLMGTGCMLRWREAGERERLWIVDPSHPIVADLGVEYFELDETETYGEYFDIPAPDELVLISWFAGGEVFRSGCTFRRGKGRIFYFRPGHEIYPIYHDANVQRIIANAVHWAAPSDAPYCRDARHVEQSPESARGAC